MEIFREFDIYHRLDLHILLMLVKSERKTSFNG